MKLRYQLVSLLLLLGLLLAACGEDSSGTTSGTTATNTPEQSAAATETTEPTEAPTETTEATEAAESTPTEGADSGEGSNGLVSGELPPGGFLERALAGEFEGTTVSAMGPFTEEDAGIFDTVVKPFEDATGIDIQYEGTKEFEATISVRVDAGDAPDIVDFPQPGLLANFARAGKIVDVSEFLPREYLETKYIDSWLDMATVEGPDGPIMGGVWERVNGKSFVWYPKQAFEDAGYEVPQTWDELMALTQMIAEDGDTPWCIGIESGAATGWPATDWIEEILLRTTSLENYNAWTRGELKFDSPEVRRAAEIMAEIWLNDEYVYGGRQKIVTTFFGDAPAPMFDDPPKCWLHKQGNFITTNFPQEAEPGVDYGFFYLPPIDEQYGRPVLVAGDMWGVFNDRPEVRAVLEWFTIGEHLKPWMQTGGAIAPHKDAQAEWYGSEIESGVHQIMQEATSVGFDGSDLMPGEVGAGSFWKSMTDWISGQVDLDTALKEIDESWPAQ